MQYTILGRTGLRVSVAGLGCGGFSRLGLGTGHDAAHAVGIVRQALDLGVTLFDTAAAYGTEEVVGEALAGVPRDDVVVCTKAGRAGGDPGFVAAKVVDSLNASLRRLRMDHVDVFQLHGVPPGLYQQVVADVVPALLRERDKGKFRFLGITETSPNDHEQAMLGQATRDPYWDTVMFAFNLMHQVARTRVFPQTVANGIGTMLMFVVRGIFARPEELAAELRRRAEAGEIDRALATDEPLGFLLHPGGAASLTDAAYRYARHERGTDVVLFGTGDAAHVRSNVDSILRPPLPDDDRDKLQALFGHLRGTGLVVPPARGA